MAKGSVKLLDVLKANITKKEDQKEIEAAEREVKKAKKVAQLEIGNLDEAVDNAKDRVEALNNNASSTLAQLVAANRELALAEANLEAAKGIFEARF